MNDISQGRNLRGFVPRPAFLLALTCVSIACAGCRSLASDRKAEAPEKVSVLDTPRDPRWDRLNHMHSEANLKRADTAIGLFDQFTAEHSGLGAKLLQNIEARRALET